MEEPKIKGSCWLETLKIIEQTVGKDAVEKIKPVLEKNDYRELFENIILANSWCNFNALVRFLLAGDRIFGDGKGDWIQIIVSKTAREHFKGIYKALLKYVISPRLIVTQVPLVWKQQINQGKIVMKELSRKHLTATATDFNPCLHHELGQIPYWKTVLELCGGKNVSISHPRCIARGEDSCIYDIKWE